MVSKLGTAYSQTGIGYGSLFQAKLTHVFDIKRADGSSGPSIWAGTDTVVASGPWALVLQCEGSVTASTAVTPNPDAVKLIGDGWNIYGSWPTLKIAWQDAAKSILG